MVGTRAKHRTKRDKHQRYKEARSEIETGDVLLFKGRGLLSRIIVWGSGQQYSHAGIAAWWEKRLFVMESVGQGVRIAPVRLAVNEYAGRVDWYSLRREAASKLDRRKLIHVAQENLSLPYSTHGLLRLAWLMLVRSDRKGEDGKEKAPALFCSEYVSCCYRSAGADLCPGVPDSMTTPGDIAGSPLLEFRSVLHQ